MTNPEAVIQIARLLGRVEFSLRLGLGDGDLPASLDASQLARLQMLVDERAEPLSAGLLQEAMASDDVQDAVAAFVFLDDRLRFLGGMLTEEQRERIRRAFRVAVEGWC